MTTGSFRLRVGTWGVADMTAAYAVSAWARQPDQPYGIDWVVGLDESDVYSPFAELIDDVLDSSVSAYGDGEFAWIWGPMSPGMHEYIRREIFSNAYFVDVTAMTRDRGSYGLFWRVVTARMQYKDPRTDATLAAGGYFKLKTSFVKVRTVGRAFSSGFSPAFG